MGLEPGIFKGRGKNFCVIQWATGVFAGATLERRHVPENDVWED